MRVQSYVAKHPTLSNMRVLILEGSPLFKGASRDTYSNRVSAINNQSVNLLKSLDAWDYILSIRCQPVMQMQVIIRNIKLLVLMSSYRVIFFFDFRFGMH